MLLMFFKSKNQGYFLIVIRTCYEILGFCNEPEKICNESNFNFLQKLISINFI